MVNISRWEHNMFVIYVVCTNYSCWHYHYGAKYPWSCYIWRPLITMHCLLFFSASGSCLCRSMYGASNMVTDWSSHAINSLTPDCVIEILTMVFSKIPYQFGAFPLKLPPGDYERTVNKSALGQAMAPSVHQPLPETIHILHSQQLWCRPSWPGTIWGHIVRG